MLVFRYIEFDTFTPASERGLPVARIVSHMLPQEILACAVGNDNVRRNNHVVHFTNDGNMVNEQVGFYVLRKFLRKLFCFCIFVALTMCMYMLLGVVVKY
jgi:hypothetical protein